MDKCCAVIQELPCAHIILREHCLSMLTKIKVNNSTPLSETSHGNHKRTLLSFETHFSGDQKWLCITIMRLNYYFEIKVSGTPVAY